VFPLPSWERDRVRGELGLELVLNHPPLTPPVKGGGNKKKEIG